MDKIDLINNTIKIFFISLYVFFVYIKLIGFKIKKPKEIFSIIGISIMNTIVYAILNLYIDPLISITAIFLIYGMMLSKIVKNKIGYSIILTLISLAVTYATYIIAIIISGLCLKLFISDISYKNPISIVTIPLVEAILLLSIFRVKRFKNGVNFFKNINVIEDVGGIVILFGGIAILLFGLLQKSESTLLNGYIFTGAILTIISVMIWIRSKMTIYYREDMKNRTIDIQKSEIDNQRKDIEELKENNLQLSTIIHKYNNRFSALEKAIIATLNENNIMEVSSELSVMLEDLKKMSHSFSKEVLEANKDNKLPTTNILGIDNIFKYMLAVATKNNIKFDLKITDRINYLVDNIIEKEELETIIGDHLKDAIIAINSSDNKCKSIMVVLGIIEDAYELCIYDTGIEFEIETLINLGKKHITTHKEEGGNGIGFMTTFDTLKRCKGSIIIEEYNNNFYTKAVIFRFDGKNKYKIRSYRAENIKIEIKDSTIIVEKIGEE